LICQLVRKRENIFGIREWQKNGVLQNTEIVNNGITREGDMGFIIDK
jgi:hypothetical protein